MSASAPEPLTVYKKTVSGLYDIKFVKSPTNYPRSSWDLSPLAFAQIFIKILCPGIHPLLVHFHLSEVACSMAWDINAKSCLEFLNLKTAPAIQ